MILQFSILGAYFNFCFELIYQINQLGCVKRGAFTLQYLHSTIDSTTSNTMTTRNIELELQCLIIGQTNTFSVEINAEKRVNQLKEAIAAKNKNAFQKIDIDAKDLTLYSIVVEEDSIDETLPKVDVAKLKQMPASHKLSRYFSDPLPDNSVFAVIVQLPPGEYNWLSMPAVLMKSYCFLLPPLRAIRSDLTRPLSACY